MKKESDILGSKTGFKQLYSLLTDMPAKVIVPLRKGTVIILNNLLVFIRSADEGILSAAGRGVLPISPISPG